LKNNFNTKQILVFTNDAGASAYIASIISNESKIFNWTVYVISNSPATKELDKYNIPYNEFFLLNEISEIIKKKQPDIILYGTGWLNFNVIIKENSKKYNIKTIALIDNWVNYKRRFSKNVFPDAIIVMDDTAQKIALDTFNSKVPIFKITNYYLKDISYNYFLKKNNKKNFVVFISEPTKVKKNHLDFNAVEYDLLTDILRKFEKVIIRLHPTEPKNKYNKVISSYPKSVIKVVESNEEDLATTLSKSKLTIGIGSTALYISFLLGIKTISYIPNGYKLPTIPLPQKYYLNDLEDLSDIDFSNSIRENVNSGALSFHQMLNYFLRRKN
jgi:hypothetical protein